jgi:DNA recombination protein RmuC
MRKASEECDGAIKLLSTGRGNLIRRVEDFKALGVKGKKDLPPQLIDMSESSEEDGEPRCG